MTRAAIRRVLPKCLNLTSIVSCNVLGTTAKRVAQMFPKDDDDGLLPEDRWLPRPDPATSGMRYMMSKHGKSVRTAWPLPSGAQKTIDTDTGSSEGCKKVRFTFVGHRQRSGLWVSMCMLHQTIIGFHVMPNGEGRRDAIYPVYRFLEKPPNALFGDYACGIEETCLNYLPHYFKIVEFYHDIFHGCTHVCSERFCSRRLAAYAVLNTSLMEQVGCL